MKRSEINAIIRDADAFIASHGFKLPPFAAWTPEDWAQKGQEAQSIVTHQLGWDITDFGSGDYARTGLFLFTIRNGLFENLKTMAGPLYAEKLLIVDVDQVTPLHYHWQKTEDIINRGGGRLMIELHPSSEDGGLLTDDVTVLTDGVQRTVRAGDTVTLLPGESITLPTKLYHKFWAVDAKVLVGEVSNVNDDHTDNHFYESVGRFPQIEEDEAPHRLLYNDYPRYYRFAQDLRPGGY